MDAIGRLAGGVAHDFNNLLTIITSYSELALDALVVGSPLHFKVEEILSAARRAAELTRQLLAFSRKQVQALHVVDLEQVIGVIAKTLPRLIGEDVELTFVPSKTVGRVRVDPVQIEQILMNLAANARDAMPEGGRLTIETSDVYLDDEYIHKKHAIIPPGRYALVTVGDNGQRYSRRSSTSYLRALLHKQALRQRHGPGIGDGLRYRETKPRFCLGIQRKRNGNSLQHLPALRSEAEQSR